MEYVKLAISTLSVGLGMACMEESPLCQSRKAFGKPIGLFESVGANWP